MSAYSESLSAKEDALCAQITQVVTTEFAQGHEVVESESIVDGVRKNAFFMVVAVFPFENNLNEFKDTSFEAVAKLSPDINDVYLQVEPATNTYAVVVDVARQGINQRDNEPLESGPSSKATVEAVSDSVLENVWEKTRENFYTDGQASFGLCIATHATKRFWDWFGQSSSGETPRVQYRKLQENGKRVNVYTRGKYGISNNYRISRSVVSEINRIPSESGMIASVTFTVEIAKKSGEHTLSMVVLVAEVADTATGFFPRYKAPKRVSIRAPPKAPSNSERSLAKGSKARRRKVAAMRAKAEEAVSA